MKKRAVIYVRTSVQVNVGEDKDSDDRQISKCVSYAESNNIEILSETTGNNQECWITFYDEGVSGTTDVFERPAFGDMVEFCLENNVHYILCEDISRFSRDAIKTEIGRNYCKEKGVDIIPVNAPDLFQNDDKTDPTRKFIRLVLGAVADLERNITIMRLQSGRRKSCRLNKWINAQGKGKCGGPKGYHELNPDVVRQVKEIKTMQPKATLRFISDVAYAQGIKNKKGKKFSATQIKRFLNVSDSALNL